MNVITDLKDKVVCGDCLTVLKEVPSNSINAIVTSPPYFNQRNYNNCCDVNGIGNEACVEDYVDALVEVFKECLRVIAHDGSIFFNVGDKYLESSLMLVPYRFAIAATSLQSVYLINQITWVKPNPQPRQFKGRLVSSTEPIFHFTKSLKFKYFPDSFLEGQKLMRNSKSCGRNIGKSYFGLIEKSDLTDEQKDMAREELEEVIGEVDTGKVWSFRMKIRGCHSAAYGGYEGGRKGHIRVKGFTIIKMYDRPMKRDVIETPILSLKYVNHPAIYPDVIVQECLNLSTEPGDVVLDPFVGSGTTAIVAKSMGRSFIAIDINPGYCSTVEDRLKRTVVEQNLFDFIT